MDDFGKKLVPFGESIVKFSKTDELANKSLEYMIWYLSLNDNQLAIASENFVYNASLLDAEVRLMEKYKSEELAKHYSTQLDQLYNEYVTRMKGK